MASDGKRDRISDWEWMTLIGAIRYYQYRTTITSVMFPDDIVRRYWGSGLYGQDAQLKLANQFALIDHGVNGEGDWAVLSDADRLPWCKFYAFCRGVVNGFIKYKGMVGGEKSEGYCFRCITNLRLYPIKFYIRNPSIDIYLHEDDIEKIGVLA